MTTAEALQALVDERYTRLDTPTWDDPHPWLQAPADDEYSRLTDPERYRIVHVRARLWAEVLAETFPVRVEPVTPQRDADESHRDLVGGVRLVPDLDGALPLVLHELEVPPGDDPALPVLVVALDRPDAEVASLPMCGCDACDDGSDALLEAIDQAVLSVVAGPYAMLRGQGWTSEWHLTGSGASGLVDLDEKMSLAERVGRGEAVTLPPGTEAVVSRGWLR